MVANQFPVITAMGHYFPPHVIDNEFYHRLGIGSSSDWIEERTGIRYRRSVLSPAEIVKLKNGETTLEAVRNGKFSGDIATFAKHSLACLQKRKRFRMKRGEWLTICGTSVPDWDIPANACVIAGRLGFECVAIDVNSACSSFIVDLHVARQMMCGKDMKVLIFNPERYSLRMNYNDRTSCVLFGDSSACALIENDATSGLAVIDTVVYSNPANYDKVTIPDGAFFSQQGKAVQKFAITKTLEATRKILKRNALTIANVDYFVGHQANRRMLQVVVEKLGLEERQHLTNVVQFGNQGAAGAPNVLSQNWELFRTGDTIVVAVVGSGLTWGATILRKI